MPDVLTGTAPEALALRYHSVRQATEVLAARLSAEDQTVQSMPDVSPTKWHRAHTSWFFETFLLEPSLPGYAAFHPGYAFLFNSYYEQVGARYPRPRRGVVSRPGVTEIAAYRRHVDVAMAGLLAATPAAGAAALVELGLHHEQQHQELLLMDIKHVLSCNPLLPAYAPGPLPVPGPGQDVAGPPTADGPGEEARHPTTARMAGPTAQGGVPPLTWVEHPGGVAACGASGQAFCFDNELPRHPVLLSPFALASRPVTCGEWLAFVEDGGYRRPELWLSDGWALVQAEGWQAPLYWTDSEGRWEVFTLAGARPLRVDEPVCHVSFHEADAFARWAGARLPTEVEWEVAAAAEPMGVESAAAEQGAESLVAEQGAEVPAGPPVRLEDVVGGLHPRPVGASAPMMGDVWQWTQSAYSPYPGYRPAAGAVGEYNGKFMVNQYVLRGGCCVTPRGHARLTYRNFFPASARWPFTGLRLAADR